MPDAEDWFSYRKASDRHVLGDMAELAVRLKSPITYDRRGTVLWYDNFVYGLGAWTETGSGTGNGVELIAQVTTMGPYALQMTAGSDANALSGVSKKFAPHVVNKWGVEVAVAILDRFEKVSISIFRHVDSVQYHARVRIYDDPLQLMFRNSDGDDELIATIEDPVNAYWAYRHLKFVVDFENLEYVRCLYDEQIFDISGNAIYQSATAEKDHNSALVYHYGRAEQNDIAVLGTFIITIDEP